MSVSLRFASSNKSSRRGETKNSQANTVLHLNESWELLVLISFALRVGNSMAVGAESPRESFWTVHPQMGAICCTYFQNTVLDVVCLTMTSCLSEQLKALDKDREVRLKAADS